MVKKSPSHLNLTAVVEMGEVSFETILFEACKKFVEEIEKFEFSLLYETDFRYAIYAELIKIMDEGGMANYPIRTEHKYGDRRADISLGENQEIAVEIKFTAAYFRPQPRSAVREAKEQLKYYLKNGAKKAYVVYFDFKPPGERGTASEIINIEEFGLSGEWKTILTKKGDIGDFLIAAIA
jgi:hypothetical protein